MSFNSTISERAPKVNYCSFDKLEFAVYVAVANFNDGRQGSIDVLQKLNICAGYHTTTTCFELNKRRKYLTLYTNALSLNVINLIYLRCGALKFWER